MGVTRHLTIAVMTIGMTENWQVQVGFCNRREHFDMTIYRGFNINITLARAWFELRQIHGDKILDDFGHIPTLNL